MDKLEFQQTMVELESIIKEMDLTRQEVPLFISGGFDAVNKERCKDFINDVPLNL